MRIAPTPAQFSFTAETLIIGAGAGGLVAALAANEAGESVLVLEGDSVPAGSTALSAGLIPAAGTRWQGNAGIVDDPDLFAADIQRKAHDENDIDLVHLLSGGAADAIEWLADRFDMPFSLVTDFDYPGHSRRRMHGLPTRSGRELVDSLASACASHDIDVICDCRVETLFVRGREVTGVAARRPDGSLEEIGCGRLILACNGFGGNREMVATNMPEITDAVWFGHDGNRGDAVLWGHDLGAMTKHLGAYQGHGNVATPHGILITWAVITEGGIQVNLRGERFWDESQGYSEAARYVLSQPDGVAWTIFDAAGASIARQFADFQLAEAQGAIRFAQDVSELAQVTDLPLAALAETLARLPQAGSDAPGSGAPQLGPTEADRFGRDFHGKSLTPPYCAVKVTGALFHTQGGLVVDQAARVIGPGDSGDPGAAPFPNLYAVGGAACGVSGSNDSGYLSGNGLLSAVVLGRIAGMSARST